MIQAVIQCLDNKYLVCVVKNIFVKYQYHHNNILTRIKYHNMFTPTNQLSQQVHIYKLFILPYFYTHSLILYTFYAELKHRLCVKYALFSSLW